MNNLKSQDREIFDLIEKELTRQRDDIELIASENIVSKAVLEAAGSILTNKYAEGFPKKRYYGGCGVVDEIEDLARERAKKLFGAEHANVQPHSGSQANMGVYIALLELGDTVLGMDLSNGGHLTHGSSVNFSGKLYNFVSYSVDDNGYIDYDMVEKLAVENKPKLIVAGASAYSRTIDFKRFREIADKVGALLMVDMAHIAGLVATGHHPNPVEYAHVVTSTTHKTLRGPRGGLILCKEEFAKKIDKAIFPGIQGGPLEHIIAAKAVSFKEAMTGEFKEYIKNVLENTKELSSELHKLDYNIVSGGTDNHLFLVDLRNTELTGKDAEKLLEEVNITLNKNTVPNETRSPFVTSGLRIGCAAITSRGFKKEDMKVLAKLMDDTLRSKRTLEEIRKDVKDLLDKYPIYE